MVPSRDVPPLSWSRRWPDLVPGSVLCAARVAARAPICVPVRRALAPGRPVPNGVRVAALAPRGSGSRMLAGQILAGWPLDLSAPELPGLACRAGQACLAGAEARAWPRGRRTCAVWTCLMAQWRISRHPSRARRAGLWVPRRAPSSGAHVRALTPCRGSSRVVIRVGHAASCSWRSRAPPRAHPRVRWLPDPDQSP